MRSIMRLAAVDLGLADRGGRLDIDDDRVVEVDQVVGRVGEEGRPAVARRSSARPDRPAR